MSQDQCEYDDDIDEDYYITPMNDVVADDEVDGDSDDDDDDDDDTGTN